MEMLRGTDSALQGANQLPSATEEMRRALRTPNRVALLGVLCVQEYLHSVDDSA